LLSKQRRRPCRWCSEPIVFATNRESGVRTPLNPEPDSNIGNLLLDETNMSFIRLDLPMIERAIGRGDALYSNHLVTCPRKKERK